MKWKGIIWLLMAGMLVLSCREPYIDGQVVTQEDGPHLGVAVQFPKMSQTKADDDPLLPASYAENTIHSLAIWVFETAEPHKQVLYKRIPEEDFPPGGGIRRYSLPVEKDFAESAPNVDIFVLANAKSIGLESLLTRADDKDLDNDPTYSELAKAAFGDDYFGMGTPVQAVPLDGLPMSGVRKNCPVVGEAPVLRVETVTLKRAVSRLRILFCKSSSLENDVKIKSVTLYSHQFPKKELVFTEENWGIYYGEGETETYEPYVESSLILGGEEVTPASCSAPEDYIYIEQQDPEAYEKMLNDAVAEEKLTDYISVTGAGVGPYFYFRESDRKISGLIEYTVNGQKRTKEFSMLDKGDFARNRTWTLLGIFVSGNNLQLSLRALPWDYNSFTLNLNDQAVVVHPQGRFEVDEETADVKKSTQAGFDWDAHLIAGTPAKGYVTILAPVGGFIQVKKEGDTGAFDVTIENNGLINPKYKDGRLCITVTPADVEQDLKGTSISLSFSVKVGDREIEAQTEVVNDKYRFVQ